MVLFLAVLLAVGLLLTALVAARRRARNDREAPGIRHHRSWAAVAIGAVAISLSGVLSSACSSGAGGSDGGSSTQRSSAPSSSNRLSGSMDEWRDAVCVPGLYRDGTRFQGALGGGYCVTQVGALRSEMWISQWESDSDVLGALGVWKQRYVATGKGDGLITAFSVVDQEPTALRPLEQFGFVIRPVANPSPRATPGVPPIAAPAPTVRSDQEADGGWTESQPSTGSFLRFQSATGNIACEIGGAPGEGTAVCEVREHTYRPEVKSDCNPVWVNSFALRHGRAPVANCYAESVFRGSLPVQAYGRPVRAGSITCSMDKDKGVTCKDSSTGHYFQAARQQYRWR